MNVDLSTKLSQVIEQIPKDELYDFCCSYAQSHDELAMALVSEFWQVEKDDYRSMVEQCLMHPIPAGIKDGDGYDWGAIAADLSRMMDLAEQKVKEGSPLDAVEIARYVMTLTCAEYEVDHPYGEAYGEMWAMRRKLLRETMEKARVMLTELLIEGEKIDDDSQRGLMKEIVAECKPWRKTHICRIDQFLEDAQEKVISEKRYMTWLTKKISTTRGGYFKKPYLEKKARYLLRHHGKEDAIKALLEGMKGDGDLKMLAVDLLTEWKEYALALQVMDVKPDDFNAYIYRKKIIEVLDLMGDKRKAIETLEHHFRTGYRKEIFYEKLRELMTRKQFAELQDRVIDDADVVFEHDYDDIEAAIYIERKMFDRIVVCCLRQSYQAEDNLEKYGKYLSADDQRRVAEDIVERMKLRCMECKNSKDYSHFAVWVKRLSDVSPVCHKIAKDVAKYARENAPKGAVIGNYLKDFGL